jgi:hypothetical protein
MLAVVVHSNTAATNIKKNQKKFNFSKTNMPRWGILILVLGELGK